MSFNKDYLTYFIPEPSFRTTNHRIDCDGSTVLERYPATEKYQKHATLTTITMPWIKRTAILPAAYT